MKVYKSPFVSYDSYFIAERPMRKYKNEAPGTTGWCVTVKDGVVTDIERCAYYNKDIRMMELVCNIPSIKKMIAAEVIKAVE